MAQRLVRTCCPDCKTEYAPDPADLPVDFPKTMLDGTPLTLAKGTGCRSCRQSGYRGRTGIHELLVNTDLIRDLVVQRVNSSVIRLEALKNGMRTLRQDGWGKTLMGRTTFDEVARVTAGDVS